jgi:hypothetical protein
MTRQGPPGIFIILAAYFLVGVSDETPKSELPKRASTTPNFCVRRRLELRGGLKATGTFDQL